MPRHPAGKPGLTGHRVLCSVGPFGLRPLPRAAAGGLPHPPPSRDIVLAVRQSSCTTARRRTSCSHRGGHARASAVPRSLPQKAVCACRGLAQEGNAFTSRGPAGTSASTRAITTKLHLWNSAGQDQPQRAIRRCRQQRWRCRPQGRCRARNMIRSYGTWPRHQVVKLVHVLPDGSLPSGFVASCRSARCRPGQDILFRQRAFFTHAPWRCLNSLNQRPCPMPVAEPPGERQRTTIGSSP